MKDTFYFPHDYNARNDLKLVKLFMKYGHEGKGIFWDLIEILYEHDGYIPESSLEQIAFEIRSNYDRITSVLRDFDLFKFDGVNYYSESALERLNSRMEKSEKAKRSILTRWENHRKKAENAKNDTNVIRTNTKNDTNVIQGKERRGEERKGENIFNPEIPSEKPEKEESQKKNPYTEEFENFWKEYLSKTKRSPGSKPNAFTQWKKISKDERVSSIERLSRYQVASGMGEFMKDAERYLKAKIWESFDEVVLSKFGTPQNTKTGNSSGRNLPPKKSWEEFVAFCEKWPFTFGMNLREIYPEIEFDQWGDFALKNRLWEIKKQGKGL